MTCYVRTNILRLSTLAAFALSVILATSAVQAQSLLWEWTPSFEPSEPRSIEALSEGRDAALSDISTVKVVDAATLVTESHVFLGWNGDPRRMRLLM